jgi:hypothetical protein
MKKWAYYNECDLKAAAWIRELIKSKLIPEGEVDERSIEDVKPEDVKDFIQAHWFCGIAGWPLALQLAGWPADRPVWTGSCPCQPFSSAGKGLAQKDERHLWPVFFDLIRQCRPEQVFGEQVASAIGHGWLDGVSADLEAEGYACGATVLGAHSVQSPHQRQRLYWVADSTSIRCEQQRGGSTAEIQGGCAERARQQPQPEHSGELSGGFEGLCGVGGRMADARNVRCDARLARDGRGEESAGGEHGQVTYRRDWQRVSFAGECLGGKEGELGDECAICGLDYANECQCPGPTQDDEFEYDDRDGILYARRLVLPVCTRLEGHAGDGNNSNQPGRLDADAHRSVATAGRNSWRNFDLVPARLRQCNRSPSRSGVRQSVPRNRMNITPHRHHVSPSYTHFSHP